MRFFFSCRGRNIVKKGKKERMREETIFSIRKRKLEWDRTRMNRGVFFLLHKLKERKGKRVLRVKVKTFFYIKKKKQKKMGRAIKSTCFYVKKDAPIISYETVTNKINKKKFLFLFFYRKINIIVIFIFIIFPIKDYNSLKKIHTPCKILISF